MTKPIVYIFLGAPGSGKGTQAKRLAKEWKLPHISTGDLFRYHIQNKTPLGMEVKSYIDQGLLCSDEIGLNILYERIAHPDCEGGYILDGFPRTIAQSEAYDEQVSDDVEQVVLYLRVSDEAIVERMAGRLTCRGCGSMFHSVFHPPKVSEICDQCGGELYQRKDDASDIVQERLKVYREETEPLIDYYTAKGNLVTIDGEQKPDEVFSILKGLAH